MGAGAGRTPPHDHNKVGSNEEAQGERADGRLKRLAERGPLVFPDSPDESGDEDYLSSNAMRRKRPRIL